MDSLILKEFLDEKAAHYESMDFIDTDPIQIPHRFSLKEDIEIDGWYIKEIIDNDFDYTKNNYIKYEG